MNNREASEFPLFFAQKVEEICLAGKVGSLDFKEICNLIEKGTLTWLREIGVTAVPLRQLTVGPTSFQLSVNLFI